LPDLSPWCIEGKQPSFFRKEAYKQLVAISGRRLGILESTVEFAYLQTQNSAFRRNLNV
jgi:hypothetical protein